MKNLVTPIGFIEAFWERLKEKRLKNNRITQIEVFEELNEEFEKEFGVKRFSDFNSFKGCRKYHLKKSKIYTQQR